MSQSSTDELAGETLSKKEGTDLTDVAYKYRWFAYFLVFDLVLWGLAVYFDRLGVSTRMQGISMYDSIAVVTGSFALIFAFIWAVALVGAVAASLWGKFKIRRQEARRA